MKYRKKPVEVEAFQWTGKKAQVPPDWASKLPRISIGNGCCLVIDTVAGRLYANPGNFIIKEPQGGMYPCDEEIFKQEYEAV